MKGLCAQASPQSGGEEKGRTERASEKRARARERKEYNGVRGEAGGERERECSRERKNVGERKGENVRCQGRDTVECRRGRKKYGEKKENTN